MILVHHDVLVLAIVLILNAVNQGTVPLLDVLDCLTVLVHHENISRLRSHRCGPTPWNHMLEQHLERRGGARNLAPTYPNQLRIQASIYDTCAWLKPRAFHEPTLSLRGEGPRDSQYHDPRSREPDLLYPQAVVGPRDGNAVVLVAQGDIDKAVRKAADAQLEDEAALGVQHRRKGPRVRSGSQTANCSNETGTWNARFSVMRRWERGRVQYY